MNATAAVLYEVKKPVVVEVYAGKGSKLDPGRH